TRISDWLSIPLLLRTLFSPFHQISADATGSDISSSFRAFIDRLFSRAIGGFVRTIMIILGTITLLLVLIISLIRLILWPTIILLPVVGIVLMITVGAPWNLV
ncbi:MAG: hypothetical protein LBM09_01520, partial [Candidatus Nomurabacteria bacterium]|nr:hypothetical protein [Candidatus Nomurabacteria bacterium]